MEEHKVNYLQGLVQTGKAQGFNVAMKIDKCDPDVDDDLTKVVRKVHKQYQD